MKCSYHTRMRARARAKGHKETFGGDGYVLVYLWMDRLSQVYAYVCTYQTVYTKYVQVFVY